MSANEPMTQEQLDAIQERVEGATAGPWEHDFCGNVDQVETQPHATSARIADNLTPGDADLIANAPQDLTDLLAEVKRLRARTTVDDAMVERGVRAHRETFNAWPVKRSLDDAGNRRVAAMRAVLDAALGTGEGA